MEKDRNRMLGKKEKLIPLNLFLPYLTKVPESIENQNLLCEKYTHFIISKCEKLSTKETSCLSTQNYSD